MNFRIRKIICLRICLIAVFILSLPAVGAGVDISYEVAQRQKERVDQAAGSLKKGLQRFGEEIAKIGPEIYKIKSQIDQYKKAGQWENIPGGEKSLLMAQALEAIGNLEVAFAGNLPAILEGLETYEEAVGDAIAATTVIKGANRDAEYFISTRMKKIKNDFDKFKRDKEFREAKEILKQAKCKKPSTVDSECRQARQKIQRYLLKLASLTREIKIMSQKDKLIKNNKKLAKVIQERLRIQGPHASVAFRQVVDTWIQLSANMEMLRNMPTDALTGKEGADQTGQLIILADKMTQMGDDMVEMITITVDSLVNNFSGISGVTISGGSQSPERILDSVEAAEQNLNRVLSESGTQ